MKVFKLAVGFAAGYVLGTRAGREKFEQIAAATRKASNHPAVIQAQDKAKAMLATGRDSIMAKLPHDDTATASTPSTTYPTQTTATTAAVGTPSRPRPSKAAHTPSPVGGDPLP
ncbi:hypothetical protein ACWT_3335 [Actinoplanes sp. SE50]|uniref:hypothetical protein n=1 Tax=unclassified Actinoplanes TaxID=2626549 RepID=UPI00023ED05C|nr:MULTISPECIES: hypothetical protein [unclassified Actinoplanes]AEV84358.1 hypothetical protein ACPL_3463 [Actinoplanes sp. SE50/110]ATO82750.1 hypothetical protein ACWT_3335 [Actinoplanes sp. SE50]SLM00157.1 uncharacterized protein ACSP50_3389 [Actinoplanes sp. SE50/110]